MTRSVGHLPINSSSELRHRPTTASPDSGLQGAQLVQVPQLSRGCTSEYSPCGVCALRGTHRHAAPGRAVWGWQETAFCWITHMPSGEIADCFSTPFLLMFYMETPYLAKGRKEESCTGTRARSVGQDRFLKRPFPPSLKKWLPQFGLCFVANTDWTCLWGFVPCSSCYSCYRVRVISGKEASVGFWSPRNLG